MVVGMADVAVAPHLSEIEALSDAWLGALDPEVMLGSEAAGGAERLAVLIRKFQAAQLRLARRAEVCNAYAARAASAAAWLARENGTSVGEAKRALGAAKQAESCPKLADAMAAGDVSVR